MLKNGVPSEVTLCRVEHGIDNSRYARPHRQGREQAQEKGRTDEEAIPQETD